MAPRDFRIEIGTKGTRSYEVVLRAADGSEAVVNMRLSAASSDFVALAARIPDSVIASSATVRRSVPDEERPVQQLGGMLFDATFGERGRSLLAASRYQAGTDGEQFRLILQIRPPELARLPWEFLFDSREDDYVCLATPLIRYPQLLAPVRALKVSAPLRILGMIARPGNQPALATADEQQRLHQALSDLERAGTIELVWVVGQTWRDLRNAMRDGPWHVLHFIGHGGYDSASQEGALALTDDSGGTYQLGAENLAMLLRGHPSLRLVLLNACDTGRASALDPFSSVAGALIRRGVPAVVAMQHEITDAAALEFTRTFYEALADELPVDISVTQARQAIKLAIPGSLEWGTPVLYMRSADGVLFDLSTDSADPRTVGVRSERARLNHPASELDQSELDDLYTRGLAALYTERWDDAVQAFRAVAAAGSYKDSKRKLEQARHQQRLTSLYLAGLGAAEAGQWTEAIEHFGAIVAFDPGYRDSQERLGQARRQHELHELRSEVHALSQAGQWQAVLTVADRLKAVAPDESGLADLTSKATAELQAIGRSRTLAETYRRAVYFLDARQWRDALQALEAVQAIETDYQDSAELMNRAASHLANAIRTRSAELTTVRASDEVNRVAFSHDGARLGLACDGGVVLIVDVAGRELLRVHHDSKDSKPVWGVAFDSADQRFASSCFDRTARIWDASSGAELAKIKHSGNVYGVAFSPDGNLLATTSDYGARISAAATGAKVREFSHPRQTSDVAFSPDGRLLATACIDAAVRIWDIATAKELIRVRHAKGVRSVAFSPDGRLLISGGDDGAVRIWDAANGSEIRQVGHQMRVIAVAVSQDSRLLASGCEDGVARVWDIASGSELLRLAHAQAVNGVSFSPAGHLIATGSRDETAQIWHLA